MKVTTIENPYKNDIKHKQLDRLFKQWVREAGIVKKSKNYKWQFIAGPALLNRTGEYYKVVGLNLKFGYSDRPPFLDHYSMWISDKEQADRVLVYHPYWLDKEKIIEWCNKNCLKVKFYPQERSWYFPGVTHMVEIRVDWESVLPVKEVNSNV